MRLFVALPLPEHVLAALGTYSEALRPLAELRWSDTRGAHVTLKFIGDVPVERVSLMTRALQSIRAPAPFGVSIRDTGWFPNATRPRVLWAGVSLTPALTALAGAIEHALVELGVPAEERVYTPHVTLARVPIGARLEALRRALAAVAAPEFGDFDATHFALFESRRAGPRMEHHVLDRFQLLR